mmetsp:Transcript_32621/g.86191  ORF Transcript_32621/g.86191 Transcript_32621/m.86191 type:complete len:96 (+) Transcript_32621:397-684(+)
MQDKLQEGSASLVAGEPFEGDSLRLRPALCPAAETLKYFIDVVFLQLQHTFVFSIRHAIAFNFAFPQPDRTHRISSTNQHLWKPDVVYGQVSENL